MNDFKDKILDGIKKGEIKAESRWRFLAHDYFFWVLTGTSTLLGALAVSSLLHRMTQDQLPLAPHMRDFETVSVFIQTVPYLWVTLLVLLGAAAWFNFKQTTNAYKHQLVVVLSMLIASMVLGGLLFGIGVGSKFDEEVRNRVPIFEKQRMKREEIRNNFLERRGGQRPDQNFYQNRQPRPYPIAPPESVR